MKGTILAVALLFSVAGPAMAFECPMDMGKIDAALAAKPNLSTEQLAEVQKLRSEGEAAHKAGNHQQAVDDLKKAMAILGVQ